MCSEGFLLNEVVECGELSAGVYEPPSPLWRPEHPSAGEALQEDDAAMCCYSRFYAATSNFFCLIRDTAFTKMKNNHKKNR